MRVLEKDGNAGILPGRVLAAPSWVFPGSLAENCRFLEGRVDEAGLLFMESASCLAYAEEELPRGLASLSLTYHVHLPSDLPWNKPEQAASICVALLEKTAFLSGREPAQGRFPLRAVLHPPPHDRGRPAAAGVALEMFARVFTGRGGDCGALLLENIKDNDLLALEETALGCGFGVCLDLGHLLAYRQDELLERAGLIGRTGLVHLSAPGSGEFSGAHNSLAHLEREGQLVARRLLRSVPGDAVIMLELFRWEDIEESLPFVRSWLLPHGKKSTNVSGTGII